MTDDAIGMVTPEEEAQAAAITMLCRILDTLPEVADRVSALAAAHHALLSTYCEPRHRRGELMRYVRVLDDLADRLDRAKAAQAPRIVLPH